MEANYEYYRIFYYVGTYNSLTRAAKVLGSSQPNVTRAMNNLESALSCRLLVRGHRGVTLTPEGEKLYLHVKAAHEHLQAGEAALMMEQQLLSGYLSVGVSEIALHGLLLPVWQQFRKRYPGIHIQNTNHSTPQAVSAVKNGLVELAVVTTPTGIAPPLEEQPLREFREILIAGPAFSELKGKTVSLEEISHYPLVCLSRGTTTYDFFSRFFSEHGLSLEPDIEAATTDQILPLVKYDLGLGFVPPFFAEEALKKDEVFQVRLREEIPTRYISMVRDRNRPLSAAARAFEKMLTESI